MGEARRGEAFATAALRFFTGVQKDFDIPDEPLKRPDVSVGPIVRYLGAARLFRPEVNMARAGLAARKGQLALARAMLYPDIGIGVGGVYAYAPAAVSQRNLWVNDPYNGLGIGFGLGLRWGLDLMPKAARIAQAESLVEETRALERYALGGVATEVENAYAVAVEAKTREEAWDRAEHRARRWISTIQDAIDLGTKTENYLMEPLRAYVNARISHAQALMDYSLALSELARISGWDGAAPRGS